MLVNSLLSGKAWQERAQQTEKSLPHKLQFHVKFMHMPY